MAKIEKDRPLPSHTKLSYDECYAKIVLEKFFPDRYSELQLRDKPDLQDLSHNVGVEVTSIIPKSEQEAISIFIKLSYVDEKEKDKLIAHLEKIGYKYTGAGLTHPPRGFEWSGLEPPDIERTLCKEFTQAVKEKIKKLNKNYVPLSRYDLFVYSELFIDEWMPEKLLKRLSQYNCEKAKYTFIYLFSLNGIFSFDMSTMSIQVCKREDIKQQLYGVGELARQMVEEGEKDEKT